MSIKSGIRSDIKDWQITRMMFRKNSKAECDIIKSLRKRGNFYIIKYDLGPKVHGAWLRPIKMILDGFFLCFA